MNTDITTAAYSTEVICTCNNCGAVFIDDNPGPGNVLYRIPSGVTLETMLRDEDEDGPFIGCKECATDGYLMDNLNPAAGGRAQALSTIIFPESDFAPERADYMPPIIDQPATAPSIYTAEEDTFWMIPIMSMPKHYAEPIWDLIQTLQPTYVREHGPEEHLYNQEEFSELTELGGVTDEQAKLIDFISEKSKNAGYIRFDID